MELLVVSLDADQRGRFGDERHPVDVVQGGLHLMFHGGMSHDHDRNRFAVFPTFLQDGRNADAVVAKHTRNLREDTGAIDDHEA